MTDAEQSKLKRKYTPEKIKAIRQMFDEDLQAWQPVMAQIDADLQCISTDKGDGSVAGPWPQDEWRARTSGPHKRPCLHEDVITPYCNQVENQIELNPMGVEAQPLGDGADEDSAEFLEGRIRNIEYEERAQIAYLRAAGNAIKCSFGAWKLETAPRSDGSQKVCIEEIQDPKSVIPGFFKKAAGQDMRRCWELDRMTHEEFRRTWPKAAIRNFEGWRASAPQWVDDTTVQVAALWHLEEDERELLRIATPEGEVQAYTDEFESGTKALPGEVVERRQESRRRVLKTIFDGVEALNETEWIDPGDGEAYPPEIPVIFVTGRIKYEKGVRVIDSLVRKGRVGQLLYDYVISQSQETMALAPRTARLGAEGSFDTSTNWNPRSITSTKEYKPTVNPETGQANPAPILEQYDVSGIQFLELAKDSVLRGIQNSLGMSATERKDRSAKSGKALESLKEEMSVGSAHYFGALQVAQERQYRILQRILPLIEADQEQLSIRDKFGRHKMVPPLYRGNHMIAIGTGKRYQTLQDKQEEFADELVKVSGDPLITLVALRGAAKMRGLGEYGDEIVEVFDALIAAKYPDVYKAMNKEEGAPMPPEAHAAMQQAQEAVKSLDGYAKQLERRIMELEEDIKAQRVKSESQERISAQDNETKIQLEQMKIDAQRELKNIELLIERVRATTAGVTKMAELEHASEARDKELAHLETESERARRAAAEQSDRDRETAATQE